MNKNDAFVKAIQAGNYKKITWIRSCLCLIAEGPDDYKEEPYAYRIVQLRDGIYTVDPEKNLELTKITDADPSQPFLTLKTKITLKKGDLPNVTKDITTTVGNVLINAICLIYPFHDTIPFQEGVLKVKSLEAKILEKLEDNPAKPEDKKPGIIYVNDYLKFTEAMIFIRELSELAIPSSSEKTMTGPPGVEALRDKLLLQHKDRLTDPAVLAEINKQLQAFDADYLKGDDTAEGFLLKSSLKGEVRRKLFLTVGAQAGFGSGVEVENVANSLAEGINVDSVPVLNSSSRAGSYNRGHQTMLGGAQFKKLIRAAANATVTEDDCKTKIGKLLSLNQDNIKDYYGFAIITPTGHEILTEDNQSKYLNKTIMVRSPMYCKTSKSDYCKVCVGPKLALHPTAVAVAVSDVGSAFLSLFLKKMHVTGLTTALLDVESSIK